MNESELTRDVVRELNKLDGCYAFRVHGGPHQKKGTLDITVCYGGRFSGIEMKMPGKEGNLTPIQAANIKKIRAAGGSAGVATSLEEAINIVGDL